MISFTVEETNLICIYLRSRKQELIKNIQAALPYMDGDMQKLAQRTIRKVKELTEAEFRKLRFCFADEI